ncbi:MAG: PorV/PorQ family protein [Alistipes sp.]|nr:PorV/PorQ family protein [Alistipes senegalensis]MCM1250396.1 PorV/PorQ family protein [Alistipes sp.]
MKRLSLIAIFALSFATVRAQEAMLPTPDAKTLGMGGVAMTTLSGSHPIYGNPAMAAFSLMPSQVSSSYYGQEEVDYYAVTGYWRMDNFNLAQLGWRQYLRGHGNNDMALDLGYSRRITDRWAVGAVTRYLHLKRPEGSTDALAADLSVGWMLPLNDLGAFSSIRAGAKLGNLGGYFKKQEHTLPKNFTVGAALDTYLSDAHEITVGVDFGYYFTPSPVRGFQTSVGAEYNLMQLVQFRAGYHYGDRQEYYPSYASVGAGIRILHLRLDFAYLFAAKDTPLHNTYSISFGLDF